MSSRAQAAVYRCKKLSTGVIHLEAAIKLFIFFAF